jgi:hypothetical protein
MKYFVYNISEREKLLHRVIYEVPTVKQLSKCFVVAIVGDQLSIALSGVTSDVIPIFTGND